MKKLIVFAFTLLFIVSCQKNGYNSFEGQFDCLLSGGVQSGIEVLMINESIDNERMKTTISNPELFVVGDQVLFSKFDPVSNTCILLDENTWGNSNVLDGEMQFVNNKIYLTFRIEIEGFGWMQILIEEK